MGPALTFTPDSRKVAYVAKAEEKWFVVVGEKREKAYSGIGTPPVFSPNGKRIVYEARQGDGCFVAVNGKEGRHYDAIVALGESRIVFDSPSSLRYFALRDDDIYLVEAKVHGS